MEYGDEHDRIPDIVDLPTPPFADDTAMTFLTSLIGRFSGRPLAMRALRFGHITPMLTYQRIFMLQRPQT
jgi:hypothetical protein